MINEFRCHKCRKYNICTKGHERPTDKCFEDGEPDIQKPCNENCKYYCGTDDDEGARCSNSRGSCKAWEDWFLSKNGWRKTVAPFRELKKSR